MKSKIVKDLELRPATANDVGLILSFINNLAAYEKLSHEVIATEQTLSQALFSTKPAAEVVLAYWRDEPVAFALFFQNFSTFLAKPGLYLEDLFVMPEARGQGIAKALLIYLAQLATARGYGRFEWSVLDWNETAIGFYKSLGAVAMDEWTVNRITGEALTQLASRSY